MTVTAAQASTRQPSVATPGIPGLLEPPRALDVDAASVSPDVVPGILLRQSRRFAERTAYLVKVEGGWQPVSWRHAHGAAVAVAAALVRGGLEVGDRVAILSENRLEWLACDAGAQAAGLVAVPIYASSTAHTVETILRDSAAAAIVCSTPDQAAKVREARSRLPALRVASLMSGEAVGFTSLHDLVAAAGPDDLAVVADRLRSITPGDLATIIYTSGTTGEPKGVMLTQSNLVASARAVHAVVPVTSDDVGISFLPWAHVYERAQGIVAATLVGFAAAIAPDLASVGEDMGSVRPTVMNAVPRMYEKIEDAIRGQLRAAGGARQRIGTRAIEDAIRAARLRRRGHRVPLALQLRVRLWDRLVFEKIRGRLGGRARIFSCGGGPIGLSTLEFFDALGLTITEGYGLTETTGAVTVNDPPSRRLGSVGRPTPGHEVRIADDGEILVRGPGVMRGYFGDPEGTARVLQDGWFATGDIGELDADGYLTITDRKKDLIVTAGGKNVAPAPIEAALAADPLIERAILIGDRRKYLVALIVPAFGVLAQWARQQGIAATADAELAADPRVAERFTSMAREISSRRASHEGIKRIAVLSRDLSETLGELTPTLKPRRRVVMEHFAEVIDALYAEGVPVPVPPSPL